MRSSDLELAMTVPHGPQQMQKMPQPHSTDHDRRCMLATLVARVWLRLRSAVPPPFPGPEALQKAERGSHRAFYALMLLLPLSGAAYGYIGGTGVPLLGSKSDATKEDVQTAQGALDVHRLLGRVFTMLWLPFHFGAEAYHYSNGRNVVGRISPFL